MICQDINKSELWVFEEISRKLRNSKNSHKNFCPNFWDRHRGSFFLFFHPDNESSEKKTFAEGGYGSTVSYPTITLFDLCIDTVCKYQIFGDSKISVNHEFYQTKHFHVGLVGFAVWNQKFQSKSLTDPLKTAASCHCEDNAQKGGSWHNAVSQLIYKYGFHQCTFDHEYHKYL